MTTFEPIGLQGKCLVLIFNYFFIVLLAVAAVGGLELPIYIPYLLSGAGTLSFAAFRAIKSRHPKAKVKLQIN